MLDLGLKFESLVAHLHNVVVVIEFWGLKFEFLVVQCCAYRILGLFTDHCLSINLRVHFCFTQIVS